MTHPGEVSELVLSGEKLLSPSNNIDLVARIGENLFKKNRDFIKEKISDNWFVVVEPVSGTLFASLDQLKLYEYAKEKFPDRLFYIAGLLKENYLQFNVGR